MPEEETTSPHMLNPFKIIKMINGDDVICKIAEEYTDAFVIEYPMSVVKQQTFDNEHSVVEHTGLQRWMNYTHDATIVIMKEKILSLANLAPDVKMYYKHLRKRIEFEDKQSPTSEEDAMEKMQGNIDRLMKIMGNEGDAKELVDEGDGSNAIPYTPMDKSKLHQCILSLSEILLLSLSQKLDFVKSKWDYFFILTNDLNQYIIIDVLTVKGI